MANTLLATIDISGRVSLTKDTDLSSAVDSITIGNNDFDEISMALTDGTGNLQAQEIWHDERTVLTVANDDLDLSGTALQNQFGENIAFTKIKMILIDIDAPDGTKSLRVGPQGVANAFQGEHGGVAAGNYVTVLRTYCIMHPYAGYTVTAATADILRIHNPGAGSVTYRILIIGLK